MLHDDKFSLRKKPLQIESSQKMDTNRLFKNKIYSEERPKPDRPGRHDASRLFPLFFNDPRKIQNCRIHTKKTDLERNILLQTRNRKPDNGEAGRAPGNPMKADKAETYRSESSSDSNLSRPNLSSLDDLPIGAFAEHQSSDLRTKMRRFVCHELPFLVKNLQPTKVGKLLLVLAEICLSNRVPKNRVKLDAREKAILAQMAFSGLNQTLSTR